MDIEVGVVNWIAVIAATVPLPAFLELVAPIPVEMFKLCFRLPSKFPAFLFDDYIVD